MNQENKYQRGKIYKIVDNTTDKIYIGSTCENTLARRLAGHVKDYKYYLNSKTHYVSSFDILANADYDIILIELYPCNSKDELLARERHYKDTLICVNKNRPGIFLELGKKEYVKQYRTDHKEHIKKYDKKRIETKFKCICSGKYCGTDKARHFRSKKHLNFINLQQLLADHDTVMIEIDNLILYTNKFIKQAEYFINYLKN
jgi:hypothetical protein